MNRVCLSGRLTRDPERKTTGSGKSVCSFSIAVDKKFKQQDGPNADFFEISAWEKTAEFVVNYFSKGKGIEIDGRLQQRKYTASDGSERNVVEVVAENVSFWGDKPADSNPSVAAQRPASQPSLEDEYDPFA